MPVPRGSIVRIQVALGLLLVVCLSLILRLGFLKVVRGPELSRMALAQFMSGSKVLSARGIIYDRHMRELAVNATAETVVVIPAKIQNPDETAAKLAAVLGISPETIRNRIVRNVSQVNVARKIPADMAEAVRALDLPGVSFVTETNRVYPNGNLASHILGFVGIDNQGLGGLEFSYEELLRGTPGRLPGTSRGRSFFLSTRIPERSPPLSGKNLVLTIDEVVQHILERELDAAMTRHQASAALAVAMDPRTGEILGLVNRPDFDPNMPSRFSESLWRNTAVSDSFEPGSTFKVVTAAAALNEGLVSESDRFTCTGYVIVAGRRLGCWRERGHGALSFEEGFWQSCNPTFVHVGTTLGRDALARYIESFGFGRRTGIDLPGEARGVMFRRMGPVELATASFGQGPAVTAIQQVVALSAAVNGGKIMRPLLVKEVRDSHGATIELFEPEVLGQPIGPETSERVRRLLEGAVLHGSGRNARIDGQRIGGKTGTAQMPKAGGGYYEDKYIASFIGMAPADDPSIVLLVIVQEPKGPQGHYGSQVAAPAFRAMVADILRYQNVTPQGTDLEVIMPSSVAVPELRGLTTTAALAHLRNLGLNLKLAQEGQRVMKQDPLPGMIVPVGTIVTVEVGDFVAPTGQIAVPDVRGLSMRDASLSLARNGLRIIVSGTGLAVSQDPAPGTYVERETAVQVMFRP